MSAKDAPIALRSHQTMIGMIDKWRVRKDYIDAEMRRHERMGIDELWVSGVDNEWDVRLHAAKNWEKANGK